MTAFINGSGGGAPRYDISGASTTLQNVPGATVSCWVAYIGGPSGQEQVNVNVSNALSLASTRANVSFRHSAGVYRVSGRRLDGDAVTIVDSVTGVSATRRHVCGVFEYSAQIARIYVDGVQENTTAVPGWTGNSSNTASLGAGIGGRADGSPTNSMFGGVAGVEVFGRALGPAEVATLFYTRGRGNNLFGLGNRYRLQGVFAFGAFPSAPDSVGSTAGTSVGFPGAIGGISNIMATRRRRAR